MLERLKNVVPFVKNKETEVEQIAKRVSELQSRKERILAFGDITVEDRLTIEQIDLELDALQASDEQDKAA